MAEGRLSSLFDYPYRRLNALMEGVLPPEGVVPIPVHIGEPQGAPPPMIARIVAESEALWGRYPPPAGSPEYRRAAASWCERRFGLAEGSVNPDTQLTAVNGTREALFQAALLAVARKDGAREKPVILLPNPLYHVYFGAALMAGAEPYPVACTAEHGFLPDYDSVPEAVWNRTAMAYLCTPANPTGGVASLERLTDLLRRCRAVDAILASDECYAEIWRDEPPAGALQAAEALGGGWANLLIFHSLSKRSGAPGMRCGFVAGDAELLAPFSMLRGYGGAQVPGPILAAGAALWRDDAHVEAQRAKYRRLWRIAENHLLGLPGVVFPDAAFFLWLDVGDGEAFSRRAWAEEGVKLMPGRYMSRPTEDGSTPGDRFVRVALVHDEASVDALCGRLARLIRSSNRAGTSGRGEQ